VTIKSLVLILKFEIQYLTVIIKCPLLFFTDTLITIISTTQFDCPNHYNQLNSHIHWKLKTQVVVVLYSRQSSYGTTLLRVCCPPRYNSESCCTSNTDAVKLLSPRTCNMNASVSYSLVGSCNQMMSQLNHSD
jgi:hypothetical protein